MLLIRRKSIKDWSDCCVIHKHLPLFVLSSAVDTFCSTIGRQSVGGCANSFYINQYLYLKLRNEYKCLIMSSQDFHKQLKWY
jgi:hypothetical protein